MLDILIIVHPLRGPFKDLEEIETETISRLDAVLKFLQNLLALSKWSEASRGNHFTSTEIAPDVVPTQMHFQNEAAHLSLMKTIIVKPSHPHKVFTPRT